VTGGPAGWPELAPDEPFGPTNLPYGVFVPAGGEPRIGVRLGDRVLDLAGLEAAGLLDAGGALGRPNLDALLAAGHPMWTSVRARLRDLVDTPAHRDQVAAHLWHAVDEVELRLPFSVADYVDFYSSEHHAANLGRILRPGQPPLLPNWRHLPVGYHGRAGTVVLTGTPIVRPSGQRLPPGADTPTFGPSTRLDIEAELGFVVGRGSRLGVGVPVDDFAEHVFGAVLVNDWSARDIQAWEYQPLGPFLGKSFATSISAWVVPLDALAPARVPAPVQDPPVLAYLTETDRYGYDVRLEVDWNATVVSRPPFRCLYWTPAQQLAHLTVNGARLRTGDLFASGTVSGPGADEVGSFIELTQGGAAPVRLADGRTRTFLEDGDTVVIRGWAPGAGGAVIGFGEVRGTVLAAGTVVASAA
jgi:fumarylacetoacetase